MNFKLVVGAVLVTAVVAVPLLLKSNRAGNEAQPSMGTSAATKGLPRFVDLGTTTCAPCKVMLGVMAELEQKYPGAVAIEFINVNQNPDQAQRYGIQVIPSQIFYSPDGRELFRHTGVFRTEEIIAKWAELGFRFTPATGR